MELFKVLPETIFRPMVSVNREIYLDALFVVRECYKQELMIRKDDLVTRLIGKIEDRILDMQLEEDVDAEEFGKIGDNLSGRAYFLVRRLVQTGWLELEYYSHSFEEFVTVPDYAVKILNLLYELTEDRPKEYNSLVYSVYAALRTADQERDEYMYDALYQAYHKTEELRDSLKSLLNNIRRYHQNLQGQLAVPEILAEHFDRYKVLIADRVYHPLKTFDSVPRFRPRIIGILRAWQNEKGTPDQPTAIDRMVDGLQRKENGNQPWEARQEILRMILSIIDTYEHVDQILLEIDRKNTTYTRSSLERMQYLLNADRDLKGKLIEILKHLPKLTRHEDSPLLVRMQEMALFMPGFLSEDSLYREPARRRKHEPSPILESLPQDGEGLARELTDLKTRFLQTFSHERIVRYVLEQLAGREEIASADLKLDEIEDFLRLLLAVLKQDETQIPYQIVFRDGYVMINGYRLPEMNIKRGKDLDVGRRMGTTAGEGSRTIR